MLRSPRLVLLAALLVVSALAACGTTKPSSDASALGANTISPGVAADTVRIGYQIGDISQLRKRLGFVGVDTGSYETTLKSLHAVVDYVNANGGAGGRRIEPVIRKLDFSSTGAGECRAFTQDTPVYAVVVIGAFENNVRPCYREARTIMLDLTAIAHDQTEFEQYSPYLWAPTQPELGSFVTAQIQSLSTRGWFTGTAGVAVVVPDGEVTRRVGTTRVVPALKALGVANTPLFTIDSSNIGTLGRTISTALAGVRSSKVDRVLVVGGARIMGIMVSDQAAVGLKVKYAISSVDIPSFLVDNPDYIVDGIREGMAGLGYSRASDQRLSSDPFPDPANANEVLCKQIVDAAGATPPQQFRENYSAAFSYCDTTLLLKAALDHAPKELTPNAFRDGMWSLGSTVQLALPTSTSWMPGRYAAVNSARPMVWNGACVLPGRTARGCFEYDGPAIALSPVS